MAKYYVERSPNGRTWEVLDAEGYSVAYVAYDTKREAQAAARVREQDDTREADNVNSAMARARAAGTAYAQRPDATPAGADMIMAGLDSPALRDAFWFAYRQESSK